MSADVLAAQQGDMAAFGRLIDQWKGAVASVCLSILRNVQASEEAAQETFIAAWKGIGELREPGSFGPWVRSLARHKALDLRRSTQRREAYVVADQDEVQRAGRDVDPLIAAERQRVLDEALDALPDDARDVMVLYYREEQSVRQVALLLGLSEAAVKKRMSRARQAVRSEVLERLGGVARATAPATAFTATVLAALAPAPAAAAGMSGLAAGTAKTAAAGLGIGTALGATGILLGYGIASRHVRPDRRQLFVRARNLSLLGLLGSTVLGLVFGASGLFVGLIGFVVLLGVVQFAVLPRVFELTPEQAADPRAVFFARLGMAFGAAGWFLGGTIGLACAWWGWTH